MHLVLASISIAVVHMKVMVDRKDSHLSRFSKAEILVTYQKLITSGKD
jgi:hypothetical protein